MRQNNTVFSCTGVMYVFTALWRAIRLPVETSAPSRCETDFDAAVPFSRREIMNPGRTHMSCHAAAPRFSHKIPGYCIITGSSPRSPPASRIWLSGTLKSRPSIDMITPDFSTPRSAARQCLESTVCSTSQKRPIKPAGANPSG